MKKLYEKNELTFAIVWIVIYCVVQSLANSFNDSGMDLVNNLCQICFAVAVGFLFVMIFYRSGSLLPCIITHSAINTLNTFTNGAGVEKQIIQALIMIFITVSYTLILTKTLPQNEPINQ